MAPPTDRALAAAARAGDRAAFGTLVERHQGALLRTCRRALGDPAAAAEVAQEAVLQALVGLAALATGAPVLVEEAVLAQAADAEREIAEELAAALASPRDARVIADELRAHAAG